MTLLSDRDIARELSTGALVLAPYRGDALQPASYDVTLGDRFLTWPWDTWDVDARERPPMVEQPLEADGSLLLLAGEFALATTVERVEVPDYLAARYEGKSSVARLGLATHVTAGFIDPGFRGQVTLELANHSGRNLRLWPGMAIGQLSFSYLNTAARVPYGAGRGSHYQDQDGPVASAAHAQLAGRGL